MHHTGLIGGVAALAHRGARHIRPAALILLVALAAVSQGRALGRGACCPQAGAGDAASAVAGSLCRIVDSHGAPHGRADDAPCCPACPTGRCDGAGLAVVAPIADVAPSSRPPFRRVERAGTYGVARPPLGWASSWSSRAPPEPLR